MYPNVINKKFINLTNSSTVLVTEQLGDVAVLDDGSRMSLVKLLDKNVFDEYIDPNSFFNNPNTLDAFSTKIKSVSDEILATMKDDDSPAIIQVDPDEEMALLQRRANEMMNGNSVVNAMQNQNDMLAHLLTDDEAIDNIVQHIPKSDINNTSVNVSEPVSKPIVNNSISTTPIVNEVKYQMVEDPILTMFRGVKRSINFETKITINELIPRLDFIEMMEDSYEKSIVEFLADEFTNKLLSNPNLIKQLIINDIKSMYSDVKSEVIIDSKEEVSDIKQSKEEIIVDGDKSKDEVIVKKGNTANRGPRRKRNVETNE